MSHTRVKTTYAVQGSHGSTEIRTLYCHHNMSCDVKTYYDEDGGVASMNFEEWESGHDLWDAMLKLDSPFKEEWNGELKDGVEHYFRAPWEEVRAEVSDGLKKMATEFWALSHMTPIILDGIILGK